LRQKIAMTLFYRSEQTLPKKDIMSTYLQWICTPSKPALNITNAAETNCPTIVSISCLDKALGVPNSNRIRSLLSQVVPDFNGIELGAKEDFHGTRIKPRKLCRPG